MNELKGFQKKYLRGRAHHLRPVVMIGQKGLTDSVIVEITRALEEHELIKIKFVELKEKDRKKDIIRTVEEATSSHFVGMIGHTALLYREHPDPAQRTITLPARPHDE